MSSAAKVAIVAGVGPGTGAAVARAFSKIGYSIALLARREESLKPVQDEITAAGGQAISFPTDISDAESVKKTFQELSQKLPGPVEVAVFNASGSFIKKDFLELDPQDLNKSLRVSAMGAFIFAQAALRQLEKTGKGTLIFTGATASLKGSSGFAAFAPAKFATRALAQSLAREYGPKGIHVAHCIVDGIIDTPMTRQRVGDFKEGEVIDPNDIAATYVSLHQQSPSCWTHELDIRPAKEKW